MGYIIAHILMGVNDFERYGLIFCCFEAEEKGIK